MNNMGTHSYTSELKPLYPVKIDDDNITGQFTADLDAALRDSKIKNIAITGSYGSGKSSLIETYFDKKKEQSYLTISLINTEKVESDDSHSSSTNVLEKRIIEQLLHKIDPKNIPETGFKIKSTSNDSLFLKVSISIFIGYLIYLTFYGQLQKLVNLNLSPTLVSIVNIVFTIFAVISFYIVISEVLKNFNIKSFSIKGASAVSKDEEKSYFNQELSEILYLFENSGFNIIIFEDLDRFENPEIFYSLRDINSLIASKVGMRFVYLVKDDIFKSATERTKFFDLIIPVVPVLNAATSYEQLYDLVELYHLNNKFLRQISIYISDFRLLKNIKNEFVVYHNVIKNPNVSEDKLFSLIVFKNLFPEDFQELQFHQGKMYDLVSNRKVYLEKRSIGVRDKIQKTESRKKELESEILSSEIELLKNYFYDRNLRVNPMSEQTVQQYLPQLESDTIYSKRLSIIRNRNSNDYDNELIELRKELNQLNSKKLKDLITSDDFLEVIKADGSERIYRFLILGGWIDEDFDDYLVLFYSNSLTTKDVEFLKSVQEDNVFDYNAETNNFEEILAIEDFREKPILNFKLFSFILNERTPIPSLSPKENSRVEKFLEEFFVTEPYKSEHYKDLKNFSKWVGDYKFPDLNFSEVNPWFADYIFTNKLFEKNDSNIFSLICWKNLEDNRLRFYLENEHGLEEPLEYSLSRSLSNGEAHTLTLDREKIIINYFEEYSVQGIGFNEYILEYILENKLDKNDLNYLFENYEAQTSAKIKNIIYNLVIDNFGSEFMEDDIDLIGKFGVDRVLNEARLDLDYRQKEFVAILLEDKLNNNEIQEFLKVLEFESEFRKVINKIGGSLIVSKNNLNWDIANHFKEKGYINSLDDSNGTIKMNFPRKKVTEV